MESVLHVDQYVMGASFFLFVCLFVGAISRLPSLSKFVGPYVFTRVVRAMSSSHLTPRPGNPVDLRLWWCYFAGACWLDHSRFGCCMLWSPRSGLVVAGQPAVTLICKRWSADEGRGRRARASERTSRSSAILLLTQQLAQQLTHAEARARRHSCPRFVLACR